MTIIGLQRRLVQVGRIRMGEKVGGTGRPTRLERWRLTSRDQMRLNAAAEAFGGKVRAWEQRAGEYELYTETDALPVLLLPGQTLSQHYELWSGGGCKRRCDGETEQMTDGPCLCDPENRECKPTSRLNVLLPDVPGIGCWRLDSTGYYAAVELAGAVDLLELATSRGVLLPARLRIDQRVALRDGQTHRFGVPTLDIDVRPLEMHAITRQAAAGEIAAAPPEAVTPGNGQTLGHTPIRSLSSGVTLAEGLAAADKQTERVVTARSAAPIGAVLDMEDIDGNPIPVNDPDDQQLPVDPLPPADEVASSEQQKLLMATAREAGITDPKRYDLTEHICGEGIRSVKRVPKDKVDELLAAFTAPKPDELVEELLAYGQLLGITQQVEAALSQHTDDREWLERQLARLKERTESPA